MHTHACILYIEVKEKEREQNVSCGMRKGGERRDFKRQTSQL